MSSQRVCFRNVSSARACRRFGDWIPSTRLRARPLRIFRLLLHLRISLKNIYFYQGIIFIDPGSLPKECKLEVRVFLHSPILGGGHLVCTPRCWGCAAMLMLLWCGCAAVNCLHPSGNDRLWSPHWP